jgi:hypothetical protein
MPDVHLRPDATHQQAIVLPKISFGDMHIPVAEIHQLGPMLVVVRQIAYLHLVDKCMLALIFDHRLGFVRLVGTDKKGSATQVML